MEPIDNELLQIINEKIELCSEWAKFYSKELSNELKTINHQIKEVTNVYPNT